MKLICYTLELVSAPPDTYCTTRWHQKCANAKLKPPPATQTILLRSYTARITGPYISVCMADEPCAHLKIGSETNLHIVSAKQDNQLPSDPRREAVNLRRIVAEKCRRNITDFILIVHVRHLQGNRRKHCCVTNEIKEIKTFWAEWQQRTTTTCVSTPATSRGSRSLATWKAWFEQEQAKWSHHHILCWLMYVVSDQNCPRFMPYERFRTVTLYYFFPFAQVYTRTFGGAIF